MTDDFQDLLQELDARIRGLEALPEEVQEQVFAVLQLIDGLHRTSVSRLAAQLKDVGLWDTEVWDAVLEDEAVNVLFTLYDQLPLGEDAQVEDALGLIRPYVHSHGGEVEVLRVEDGVVHLRLKGSCQSCSAKGATLEHGVEAALREGFTGFRSMVVHESDDAASGTWIDLPMAAPAPAKPRGPVFQEVAQVSDLPTDRAVLANVEGRAVLLVRLGSQAYAYDPTCPECKMPLEGAKLSSNVLVCPWQNCAFDLRSGRRVDGEAGENLRVYPVSVQGTKLLLAMEFAPTALFGGEG